MGHFGSKYRNAPKLAQLQILVSRTKKVNHSMGQMGIKLETKKWICKIWGKLVTWSKCPIGMHWGICPFDLHNFWTCLEKLCFTFYPHGPKNVPEKFRLETRVSTSDHEVVNWAENSLHRKALFSHRDASRRVWFLGDNFWTSGPISMCVDFLETRRVGLNENHNKKPQKLVIVELCPIEVRV